MGRRDSTDPSRPRQPDPNRHGHEGISVGEWGREGEGKEGRGECGGGDRGGAAGLSFRPGLRWAPARTAGTEGQRAERSGPGAGSRVAGLGGLARRAGRHYFSWELYTPNAASVRGPSGQAACCCCAVGRRAAAVPSPRVAIIAWFGLAAWINIFETKWSTNAQIGRQRLGGVRGRRGRGGRR